MKRLFTIVVLMVITVCAYAQHGTLIDMNFVSFNTFGFKRSGVTSSNILVKTHVYHKLSLLAEFHTDKGENQFTDVEKDECHCHLEKLAYQRQISFGAALHFQEDFYAGILFGYNSGAKDWNNLALIAGYEIPQLDVSARLQRSPDFPKYVGYSAKIIGYPLINYPYIGAGISLDANGGFGPRFELKTPGIRPFIQIQLKDIIVSSAFGINWLIGMRHGCGFFAPSHMLQGLT